MAVARGPRRPVGPGPGARAGAPTCWSPTGASPGWWSPSGPASRRLSIDGAHGAGRSRAQPPGPGPPHRGRRAPRPGVGGRGAGLGRGRHPDERRRPRLGHRGHPGRLPVGGPDLGRGATRRRPSGSASPTGTPTVAATDVVVAGVHRARARPTRRGQGGHRRDRALAAGQPARGQQCRIGLHQPAGRLGRPADRGLRAEGLPDRDRPRSRPSTPTSSRPTRTARPTTCAGSSPTCSRRWPRPPACPSAPRCAWSDSTESPGRDRCGDDPSDPAPTVGRRPSIDPRIRQRRADIQRSQGPPPAALDRRARSVALVLVAAVVVLLHTPWFSARVVTVSGAHPHTSDGRHRGRRRPRAPSSADQRGPRCDRRSGSRRCRSSPPPRCTATGRTG